MAATVFTTWAALYQAMQNALADFAAKRMQVAEYELTAGGISRRFKYRSFEELQKGLQFARQMMDEETGAVPGRTYAGNGGGRWM